MKGAIINNATLLIRFNVEIFSSLGSTVAKFTITEAKKVDAEKYAERYIVMHYPKGRFTYKIS